MSTPPRAPSRLTTAPFRLGAWRVEPQLNRLLGPDGPEGVEPKVMSVLLVLAERPGAVVSREELLDAVWPDVYVGEKSLTMAVSKLRRALGDDPREPRLLATIPKNGYRLVAPVEPLDLAPSDLAAAEPARLDPPVCRPVRASATRRRESAPGAAFWRRTGSRLARRLLIALVLLLTSGAIHGWACPGCAAAEEEPRGPVLWAGPLAGP